MILTIIAMIVIFCLLWVAIGFVPTTPRLPWLKTILYVALCAITAYIIYTRFVA